MDTTSDIYFLLLGKVPDKPFLSLLIIPPNYFGSLFSFPLNCTYNQIQVDIIEMVISWGKGKKKCSNLKMLLKTSALSPPPLPITGQHIALKRTKIMRVRCQCYTEETAHQIDRITPVPTASLKTCKCSYCTVFRQTCSALCVVCAISVSKLNLSVSLFRFEIWYSCQLEIFFKSPRRDNCHM